MNNRFLIASVVAVIAGTALAHHDAGKPSYGPGRALPTSPKTGKGIGVIQQINLEKGVVTIKHGPLQGIVMPGMTMSFLVKDKAMLSNLQPSQKVDFELAHENGIYVITRIR